MPTISELENKYRNEGYTDSYNNLDESMMSSFDCTRCNNPMRYIGLKKGEQRKSIAHCDNCGKEFEKSDCKTEIQGLEQ